MILFPLLPPESEKHRSQVLELSFSHLKGRNLAEMDAQVFGGGSDPYMYVYVYVRVYVCMYEMSVPITRLIGTHYIF